jgi:hypothetical protein
MTSQTETPTVDPDGLPIYAGPEVVSPCCWVNRGDAHNLSCENVSMEQFNAWFASQSDAEGK